MTFLQFPRYKKVSTSIGNYFVGGSAYVRTYYLSYDRSTFVTKCLPAKIKLAVIIADKQRANQNMLDLHYYIYILVLLAFGENA